MLFMHIHQILCQSVILDYKNLKFEHLIDNIAIDLWSSRNFASMEDRRRKYDLMMNL